MPLFYRVGKRETFFSLAVLGVLLAVAVGVWRAQFDFYPAVRLDAEFQPSGGAPGEGSVTASVLEPIPAGVLPFSAPEFFGPDTLADKINGKAELYLAAGFQNLHCQRFRVPSQPAEGWLEMLIYNMGTNQDAHAVFSVQRREGAEPLELTRYAYQSANAVFMVHGPFYVEIVASSEAAPALSAVRELAHAFVRQTPLEPLPAGTAVEVSDLFPRAGLDPDSIRQLATDAFGMAGLDRVYTAEYPERGAPGTAFITRRASADEAGRIADSYEEFLLAFGGSAAEAPLPGARMVRIMDNYELFRAYGPFFFGVHQAGDPARAAALLEKLQRRLAEEAG